MAKRETIRSSSGITGQVELDNMVNPSAPGFEIVPVCHRDAGMTVNYYKKHSAVSLHCKKCGDPVIMIAVGENTSSELH